MVELPFPSILAPIRSKQSIKSPISGSQAALLIIVVPLASEAAIIKFSVAPTDANRNFIGHPFNPFGAVAYKYPSFKSIFAPSISKVSI